MPLVFKVAPKFEFSGKGTQHDTQQVSFDSDVIKAEVALQGFSFDFEGVVERPIDKVVVNIDTLSHDGNDVTIKAAVNYSGKAKVEYNATVSFLVIALVQ